MKKHTLFWLCCLAAVLLALTGCDHDGLGGSSGGGSSGLGITQSQIAKNPARLAGAQISFEQALQMSLAQTGGSTLKEIELERKRNGALLYEVEILGNGRKVEVYIDAMTGQSCAVYTGKSARPPL